MTGAAALLYFTAELSRAMTQLGVSQPLEVKPVTAESRDRRTPSNVIAYRVPEYSKAHIEVVWRFLWTYPKRTLRCVARHEAIHVALGHLTWNSPEEREQQHDQIDAVLRSKWNEPAQCGLGSRKKGA